MENTTPPSPTTSFHTARTTSPTPSTASSTTAVSEEPERVIDTRTLNPEQRERFFRNLAEFVEVTATWRGNNVDIHVVWDGAEDPHFLEEEAPNYSADDEWGYDSDDNAYPRRSRTPLDVPYFDSREELEEALAADQQSEEIDYVDRQVQTDLWASVTIEDTSRLTQDLTADFFVDDLEPWQPTANQT